jgi:hypothetical protein
VLGWYRETAMFDHLCSRAEDGNMTAPKLWPGLFQLLEAKDEELRWP